MSKHTPGPWSVRCLDEIDEEYRIEAASTLFVDISPCSDGYTPGQTKFNARLIAAAPELLAVCRKAEPILGQYIDDQCERGDTPTDVAIVLVEMRHAIARAEEEPCPPN
jgi:hypothetical protein